MWEDVAQQLAGILKREVFGCLLRTPSYAHVLRRGGLTPPFEQYLKYKPTAFPPAFEGSCQVYAKLITDGVRRMACLAEDAALRADIVHGPVSLFRMMNSRNKGPEPSDLRMNTSYFGDWWFTETLLEDCLERCRALELERRRNPALTEMTPDRCLKAELRRRLAIRMDWNALAAIRRLVLTPNESIPVIFGTGLPQPVQSGHWRNSSGATPQLPGGELQIWIPWTPQKAIQLWTPKGGLTPNARL